MVWVRFGLRFSEQHGWSVFLDNPLWRFRDFSVFRNFFSPILFGCSFNFSSNLNFWEFLPLFDVS